LPHIEANGTILEYTESGSGPPLVLVHGSMNDHRAWTSQMGVMSTRYRVIAYSRRYHHPNQWVGDGSDYSVSLHAEDLTALIRQMDIAPAHLVGSSYGAYTALVAAMHHPELVRSLVLGEPPVVPLLIADPTNPLQLLRLIIRHPGRARVVLPFMFGTIIPTQKALRRGDLEGAVRIFVDGVIGEGEYARLPSAAKTMIGDNAPALKAELLDGDFEPFPAAEARSLTRPALLLYGERSIRFFGLISDELSRLLPNVEVATIPETSHDMHTDNPIEYNRITMRFLEANDAIPAA